MPLFRYEALDRTGNKVVGAMNVADEQALSTRLQSMGYQPTAVEVARKDLRPAQSATQAHKTQAQPLPWPGAAAPVGPVSNLRASKRSTARMYHQLYIAFRAGMPAYQALSTVSAQVFERQLRAVLMDIANQVQNGHPISDQMERYPRVFTVGDVGMIRAAERGGFLPEAFENLAQQHETDDNTQRRLRIWVWFFHLQAVTFFWFVPLGLFINAALRAGFSWVAGLQAVLHGMLVFSLPGTAVYLFLLWLFFWYRNNPAFTYRWHRMLLRLPEVGRINRLRANAVFTRTLERLVYAGLPLNVCWHTASTAVPNLFLAYQFAAGTQVVEGTARLSTAMVQTALLDPTDIGMVATGEATGEISESLKYLADRYEEENRIELGSTVLRGAMRFAAWGILAGLAGLAGMMYLWNWGNGGIFKAVEKAMGVGD